MASVCSPAIRGTVCGTFRDCSFRASPSTVETPPPSTLIIAIRVLPNLTGHTLPILAAQSQSHIIIIPSNPQYIFNSSSLGLSFCASTPTSPKKPLKPIPLPIPWPTTGALPKADPQKQGSTINDLCTTPNVHTRTTSPTRSSSLSTSPPPTSHLSLSCPAFFTSISRCSISLGRDWTSSVCDAWLSRL